ncbi:hypothetical protein [Methylobacterium sp. J-070]|uniref:hypothetical protein n=1 Tax=Methylobacterium sp. J-070 TaxID=2836650 RepID=UPI001FB8991F|nr:hypothetical protein [Methylobacterium sp. J-070]MCJ2051834.1 hypothetical protein [Methylobacterium sp. J-070]
MAERHSSQNGQHGGPGLPMFYGVIGGTGLMLAALTLLMAGQVANSHRTIGHTADTSSLSGSPTRSSAAAPNLQPSGQSANP